MPYDPQGEMRAEIAVISARVCLSPESPTDPCTGKFDACAVNRAHREGATVAVGP